MKELTCPECGKVFKVDEADYAAILSQVKGKEFDMEIERRMSELQKQHEAEKTMTDAITEQKHLSELSMKDAELSKKDSEIVVLKQRLESIEAQKDSDLKLALVEQQSKLQKDIHEKDTEIERMRADAKIQKNEAELKENHIREQYEERLKQSTIQYEERLKATEEQVAFYKDYKTRLSTKMIGESLEQYCSNLFEMNLRSVMPEAEFGKDNDASEGTKGDFIFKAKDDGVEYLSIMFEMKNEADDTEHKHKNEDFLKKLDSDRQKKGCEYAVLVSMLEPDNNLYNNGIVDKSHLYDKMYVIRPQFFIPLITLLVQTSKKCADAKKQLELAQKKEVDVTMFENKLEDFKTSFAKHFNTFTTKHTDAIKAIDDAISKLQKTKALLEGSDKNLGYAENELEGLTIRKLTYKNPTMKAKFEEAREAEGHTFEEITD